MTFKNDDENDNLEKIIDSTDLDPIEEKDFNEDEAENTSTPKSSFEPIEDEDTEKEIIDNEDIANQEANRKSTEQDIRDESNDLLDQLKASPQSDESTVSPKEISALDKYKDYMNQYKKLQEQRRKSDALAGFLAAGDKIGQSIAGKYSGNFKPDLTGIEMMQQQASRPISDLEQQQVVSGRGMQLQGLMNSNDPNSAQSKLVRQYLNQRLNMNLPEDVSASDAAAIMKMIGRPQMTHLSQLPMVNQQTGEKTMATFNPTLGTFTDIGGNPLGAGWVRDYRAQSFIDPATQERMSFSGGTGKVAGALTGPGINRPGAPAVGPNGQPVELNRTMLTAQQQKQLDHTRDKFLAEVKDDRNAINSADRVINVLDTGDQLNGDILGELRDQMSRAFGQKGHITDAQMGRVLGREDWKSKIGNAISVASEGKLDDENRDFLRKAMTAIRDQNQLFVTNKAKVYSANLANDFGSSPNLKKTHVTPESINKLLNVQSAAASSAAKTVIAKGYNKKTNQTQFVYSDGSKEIVDGKR